jgi:hypothetical protein
MPSPSELGALLSPHDLLASCRAETEWKIVGDDTKIKPILCT